MTTHTKQMYEAPQLIAHGTVDDLTLGGGLILGESIVLGSVIGG